MPETPTETPTESSTETPTEARVRRRPISRVILGAALLVLGAVAAWRLPLGYLPAWSFPELDVDLSLPATEPLDLVTRRYVAPIESALRQVGGVRDSVAEVGGRGGRFRVRLEPGVDLEVKAARLESELESLRRELPERARLGVRPAGQTGGERTALIFLESAGETGAVDPRLIEALRVLPEVRGVEVAGERDHEIRVQALSSAQDLASLGRAVGASGRPLGDVALVHDGRRLEVLVQPPGATLGERSVRRGSAVVPLGSVARVELRRDEPSWQAHVGGESGHVIEVSRQLEASPLAVGRALRATLRDYGQGDARFLIDESEPLRLLLERLALGAAAASVLLAFFGWLLYGGAAGFLQGATVPLALAASFNALWLASFGGVPVTLDVLSLPPLVMAVATALFFHGLRVAGPGRSSLAWPLVTVTACAALVPVAVVLAGGNLGTLLEAPARAFALAVPAACLAILLVPAPRRAPHPRALGAARFVLRRPWAVLLLGGALAYALLVLFGDAMRPVPGRLSPVIADLSLSLRFAEDTRAAEAEALVSRAEEILARRPEVVEQWSVIRPSSATLGLRVAEDEREPSRLASLGGRLQLQLSSLGATVQATPLAGSGGQKPLRFRDELVDGPEADEQISRYRMLLRSPDPGALSTTLERLGDRIRRDSHLADKVVMMPDWRPPGEGWILVPRPGADPRRVESAAALVAARSRLPFARPTLGLPGNPRPVQVRVTSNTAPPRPEDPPELAEVLAAGSGPQGSLVPSSLFEVRETFGSPVLLRQRGSFVLPITFHFTRAAIGQRPLLRATLEGRLRNFGWPAGVDRELPSLEPRLLTEETLQLLAVGATLPLLLFGLGACRLDSLALALAAAVPAFFAVAWVSPLFAASATGAGELALLAVAVSVAAVWALSAEVAGAVRVAAPSRLAVAAGYRWLARRLPGLLLAAGAWLALLAGPTLGLDSGRHAWVTALRAASLTGVVGGLSAFLVLPVLLRAVDRLRFHDRAAARLAAEPPAWRAEGRLRLSTRNLNKVYGNGFRALERVEVTLEPGIIGLLGPNGAGKTTFLRCLCGLLEPSRGGVAFRGVPVTPHNLPSYRRLVGFLPQSFNAYEGFTVEAFLDFWALERGLLDPSVRRRELEAVLDQVGLTEAASRKVRDLSGGMRRRIGIARALLGAPPILIVDEPTTGLDVESRNRLRESLLRAAGERIIIFSTHIASDIAAAASRILILDGGRLQFDGAAGELVQQAEGRVFEALIGDQDLRAFAARYRVTTRVRTLEGIRVRAVAGPGQEPAGRLVRPNLEEAYLAKLGQGARAPGGRGDRERGGSLLDLGLDSSSQSDQV